MLLTLVSAEAPAKAGGSHACSAFLSAGPYPFSPLETGILMPPVAERLVLPHPASTQRVVAIRARLIVSAEFDTAPDVKGPILRHEHFGLAEKLALQLLVQLVDERSGRASSDDPDHLLPIGPVRNRKYPHPRPI